MSEKLLPDILRKDKRLKAFAELEDKNFKEVSAKLPYLFVYKLENLSDSELEELAWQFDISKIEWELATDRKQKEELIKNNILLKAKRGTPWAIKRVLELLGLKGQLQEWFEYDGKPYHFKLNIFSKNKYISPQTEDKLIQLINQYKNERSHIEKISIGYEIGYRQVKTRGGFVDNSRSEYFAIVPIQENFAGNSAVKAGFIDQTTEVFANG